MNKKPEELDEEALIDFIGDENDSTEIDSSVASSVMDTIENTLDDMDLDISFGVKLSSCAHFDWTEEYGTLYETGELVYKKGMQSVYKVVGYGKDLHTYDVKKSGDDIYFEEDGINLIKAPEGAVWQSHADATDPLKVPGLNISCPSNKKFNS